MTSPTQPTDPTRRRIGRVITGGAAFAASAGLVTLASVVPATAAPQSTGFNAYISASQSRAALGTTVTINASTDHVMNNQNYFLRITDVTSGQVLKQCSVGTTCTATYKLNTAATHVFSAHLDAGLGGSAPYPTLSSASTSVQWKVPTIALTNTARQTSQGLQIASGSTAYLDAWTDVSLTGSNYFVSLRDVYGGELKRCFTGVLCTASQMYPNAAVRHYVAHLDSKFAVNGLYPTVAQSATETISWMTAIHVPVAETDNGDVSVYNVTVNVSRDGTWSVTGDIYDGGWIAGDDYAWGFAWQGLGHGAEQSGNISHDTHDPLTIHGKDPWIAAHWNQIVGTPIAPALNASSDFWGDVLGIVEDLEPYAGDALTWLLAA